MVTKQEKHLTADEIKYQAESGDLWADAGRHYAKCSTCQNQVINERQKIFLRGASRKDGNTSPNKMGKSHPSYLAAISS